MTLWQALLLVIVTSAQGGDTKLVLETRQIILAEYPYAFNPSLVRWDSKILMSFRVIPDAEQPFNSWLGLVELDESFHAIGVPQRLDLHGEHLLSRAEDGRLIYADGRLYIVFSDNCDACITRGGFRMYIAEILFHEGKWLVKDVERLSFFDQQDAQCREKNWVPFEYAGQLLCAYSLNPHLILHPLRGTGSCETFVSSESALDWQWGALRGGTPALLDGDHYLAFFHSSYGKDPKKYVMGAYTFSRELPFAITHVSKQPIVADGFYNGAEYKPRWKPVQVVFPGGFIADDDCIWVTYGRQDHEMWVAKLDKRKLYESLRPVTAG